MDFDDVDKHGVHSSAMHTGRSSSGPAEEQRNKGETNDRLPFSTKDAREWKDWRKWVEAHIADIEDRVTPKRLRPMLCKRLRGHAKEQFGDVAVSEMKTPGGDHIILDVFENTFPDDTPVDRKILAFD